MTSKYVTIQDLGIEIIDGDRGKNYPHQYELFDEGYCLFLSAQNVTSNGFNFIENKFITKEKDLILRNGKLEYEDIVITTRGTVGNVGYYTKKITYKNLRINSGMLILRCNKNINSKYLYYVLSSKWFHDQILSFQTGTAQPQLPKSHFQKMKIPFLPLQTQEKIARVLSSLDNKIELNNKINQNLEQQAQAIFKSWFVDFEPFGGKMPKDWRIGKLGELVEITSGKRPQLKQADKDNKFDIPIIGASNIMGYTNAVLYNEPILITGRVGTHGIINKYNKQCWPSDNTLVIKSEYYEYIYQQLKRVNFAGLNRGSTQPLITQKDLFDVPIVIPSFQEIKEYEQFATQLNVYQDNLIAENEKLKQLRDTLLPKLMSGEIDVDKI